MDPTPPTPSPAPAPPPTERSAQVALAVFLAVLLGLLAFRGYGTRLGARPTDITPALTDINTADRAELRQLPGVGPKLARAIDDHRTTHGPFKSVEDLDAVKGVGPKTLDRLRSLVRAQAPAEDGPPVLERRQPVPPPAPRPKPATGVRKLQPGDPPVDVNTAGVDELQRLPGVGVVTAHAIAAARPFRTVDELDRVKGIGPKTMEKIRPFVVVK